MLHVVRLATVHPALVHFTIGALPIIVTAYAVAAWRRSTAWTLAGDVALVVAAAITLVTGAFGLVSNAVVPWPGGIQTWRWLHLAFGVSTTVLLALFAAVRLLVPRDAPAGPGTVLAAIGVAAVAAFTGWIGGEVLVFHSGMAVRAAGDGALAPRWRDTHARPTSFLDAMRQARASWAGIETRLASMLVQHPRDEDFRSIVADAQRLQEVAKVMADEGGKDPRNATVLTSMAQALGGDANDIEEAARKKSLQDLAKGLGEASSDCADCHEQVRWKARAP